MKIKCFHCGLPVLNTDYKVSVNGSIVNFFCCPGCLAVSQFILDNGFEDYYKNRDKYANRIKNDFFITNFSFYDDFNISKKFVEKKKSNLTSIILAIDGITCTACTWLIERYIGKINGVYSISINMSTCRATVVWDSDKIVLSNLLKSFLRIGYRAYPYNLKSQEKKNKVEYKNELKKILVSGLGMLQVMMLSASLYVGEMNDMHHSYWIFIRWICFLITFPVLIYSSSSIFYSSYRSIKNLTLGMDFTVSLSLLLAFLASINNLLIDSGDIYFDSICMFIFFLLFGRFLEMKARHQSGDIIYSLHSIGNDFAIKLINNNLKKILIEDIAIGDIILIKPGTIIPVDGVILSGSSYVNESILTGESRLLYKSVGLVVLGGTTNVDNLLFVKVTHEYKYSMISLIINMLESVNLNKPKINIIANSIANYFVFSILLLTFFASFFWILFGREHILNIVLAMLVVSCPCALSLAVPIAMTSMLNSLVKIGFLVTKDHVLDTLNCVTDIVFDKTGTLTVNDFVLNKIKLINGFSIKDVLLIAFLLEENINHPIASSFLKYRKFNKNNFNRKDIKNYVGLGVEGKINGEIYRLGKYKFIKNLYKKDFIMPNFFTIALASRDKLLAYFKMDNSLRTNLKFVINNLKLLNMDMHIISGDSSCNVDFIANKLGIRNKSKNISVKGKVEYIKKLIIDGKIVMMVGDGINDAPALSNSHISVSMGSGSDLAKINSDVILLNNNVENIFKSLNHSVKLRSIIKQNFIWAVCYNFIGLFFAMFGFITPYYAAIGMSLSSLIVVFNSLRLKKI